MCKKDGCHIRVNRRPGGRVRDHAVEHGPKNAIRHALDGGVKHGTEVDDGRQRCPGGKRRARLCQGIVERFETDIQWTVKGWRLSLAQKKTMIGQNDVVG